MDEDRDGEEKGRSTANLVVIAVVVVLAVAGLFLTRKLMEYKKLEDCLMARRANCIPVEAPP
jgi:hypothetical protein